MAHRGKLETGHKWTTWNVKWKNHIVSMVGLSGILLDYGTRHNMPVGWTTADEQDHLKISSATGCPGLGSL